MGFFTKKNKGQSSLEYAVVLLCIVAALLAIQFYIRRALQGRFRESADRIGEQYEPRRTTGQMRIDIDKNVETVVESHTPVTLDGVSGFASRTQEFIHQDETRREGHETVGE